MNYIGSKNTLLPFLSNDCIQKIPKKDRKVFCDLFAGTGVVGRYFKGKGMKVIANDLQYYAYALNKAYIEINKPPTFSKLRNYYRSELSKHHQLSGNPLATVLAFINDLPGEQGFIAKNYGPEGSRLYFTQKNAEKADAIRNSIKVWREQGLLSDREFYYLLCSLLEAIDQVANTASVYGAYLKDFKESAKKPIRLKALEIVNHVTGCKAHNKDANELIEEIECDILYLDPPYNHRQYGANYHVLETIAAYDNPEVKGITGMRDYQRSRYCQRKFAREALEHLIQTAQAKHILLSYNDEGLLSLEEIRDILSIRGEPMTLIEKPYNRFKADNNREYKRDSTIEYVHYIRVIRQ